MDSLQINNLMNEVKNYIGTFSRDTLPQNISKGHKILIANTDTSYEPGEHWVCISLNKNKSGEYFDSYGLPPLHQEFIDFLNNNCPNGWGYSPVHLQCSTCITCGHYCVVFAKLRSMGVSYCNFLSLFTKDPVANDEIIRDLMPI
jgi:hypothetical protein